MFSGLEFIPLLVVITALFLMVIRNLPLMINIQSKSYFSYLKSKLLVLIRVKTVNKTLSLHSKISELESMI